MLSTSDAGELQQLKFQKELSVVAFFVGIKAKYLFSALESCSPATASRYFWLWASWRPEAAWAVGSEHGRSKEGSLLTLYFFLLQLDGEIQNNPDRFASTSNLVTLAI